MAQMRTIRTAIKEIVKTDPNSGITKHALRTLVTTGRIPSVKIGTKYLIDLNVVGEYFGLKVHKPDEGI